jgi:enoyl-CoA hydratase/carnithine racemase
VTEVLRTESSGAVRLLVLDRPQARNALSAELVIALHTALLDADADESVRAVVLTGSDPAFCAGVDLKEAARDGAAYFDVFTTTNCIAQVASMRTPVIGAVNGAAFTGGLELALGCDFLVASERAVFADTHIRVGVLPGGGLTARLPLVVGQQHARRLSLTGEIIDAAEALRIGLVTEVVGHGQLLGRALELAAAVAEVPLPTLQAIKQLYVAAAAPLVDNALTAESKAGTDQPPELALLEERRRAVMARNHAQRASPPSTQEHT